MNNFIVQPDATVDSFINWAASRAFAIGLLPQGTSFLLSVNDAYLFYRIAAFYERQPDEKMLTVFLGCVGAETTRHIGMQSLSAVVRAPLCAAVTYALGKTIKKFFASDWTIEDLKVHRYEIDETFKREYGNAKKKKWKEVNRDFF